MCILTDFQMTDGRPVYDFTKQLEETGLFDNLIMSQGYDNHLLIVRKMDKSVKRFDGKMAGYCVEYRELSVPIDFPESYACVEWNEFTYEQRKSIKAIVDAARDGKSVNMFKTLSVL